MNKNGVFGILVVLMFIFGCGEMDNGGTPYVVEDIVLPENPVIGGETIETEEPEEELPEEPIIPDEPIGINYDEMSLTDIQATPEMVVDAYLYYTTLAQTADSAYWGNAYILISPTQKKNWAKYLSSSLYEDEYAKVVQYGKDGVVYDFIETAPLGTATKVIYDSSGGEMFYLTQSYEGSWYVFDGSISGAMWWRNGEPGDNVEVIEVVVSAESNITNTSNETTS